jgi:microcin C transport system substrate-binding protein
MKRSRKPRPPHRLVVAVVLSLGLASGGAEHAFAAHAIAQFGEPKYPRGFHHFDYANPDAPKGGTLNLSVVAQNSSFDKLNPFSLKGKVAPGVLELMFETLTIYSLDEVNTQYGLLADDIVVEPDFSAATFHIDAAARFSNGDPVTASDVRYSFETLTSKQASPRFRAYFSEIYRVETIDAQTVRFVFARKGRDLPFVAGSLPVFSPKWGRAANGEKTAFGDLRLEMPITTGPYVLEKASSGSNVTYIRNPDYWGKDLPSRRGSFNFDRVVYKLYKDMDTQVAALRAGEIDFFLETRMRYWCCQYIGKRFDSGELVKVVLPHENMSAMNGYVFNLRRDRFKDPRVRRALNYAFDWEWVNQKILAAEFSRQDSYFAHSPLQAKGLPSEAELQLLEPYRDRLPPEVFGPMIEQPSTRPPSSLRRNLIKALELFAQAGWHVEDGVLRNEKGAPFVIEIAGSRTNLLLEAFYRNLTKLGITLLKRPADPAADRARLRNFDYDFASIALREARDPGAELWRNLNSADADVPGSENVIGVKSHVADALMRKLLDSSTKEEQLTAAHALDRVLMHGHYIIPWRHLIRHYIIHSQHLRRPKILPTTYGAYEWLLAAWWDGHAGPDLEKAADLTLPRRDPSARHW